MDPNPVARSTSPTDEELVRLAQQGVSSAFESLISRYERKITNHIYGMLRDYDRALDLAQDTFIKLLTRVDKYRETAKFSTWLYRISTNLAIDEIRRRRRWRWVPFIVTNNDGQEMETVPLRITGAQPGPDVPLFEEERRDFVRIAIDGLPPHYKSAVLLKDMQDLPYDEVSEILEIPVGTVKSRLNAAIRKLNEYWNMTHAE